MRVTVSAPGEDLKPADVDAITADLEKIGRRLNGFSEEVVANVRVSHAQNAQRVPGHHVVLEVHYGPNHLIAKTENPDMGMAVREAREEILRQINDRSTGGHSSQAKGR
ncbi:MAG TPA: HPF/RaiA family ribosome-associated protein [Actinomycetota bacterium]|nr:HPF/RaiA family ribosome-associated protein [Actinomycetota bacterium]